MMFHMWMMRCYAVILFPGRSLLSWTDWQQFWTSYTQRWLENMARYLQKYRLSSSFFDSLMTMDGNITLQACQFSSWPYKDIRNYCVGCVNVHDLFRWWLYFIQRSEHIWEIQRAITILRRKVHTVCLVSIFVEFTSVILKYWLGVRNYGRKEPTSRRI